MANSRQYVVSIPTGSILSAGHPQASVDRVHKHLTDRGVQVHGTLQQGAVKLTELDDAQLAELKANFPGVVVEPNIRYHLTRHPLLEGFSEADPTAVGARRTVEVSVVDEKTKAPVAGVTVYLIVNRKEKKGYKDHTGDDGVARIQVARTATHFELVALMPKFGYWNRKLDNVSLDGDKLDLFVRPLLSPDEESYTWAVQDTKMVDGAGNGGAGVKIAVIDTGIRKDHEDLHPAGGVNCVLNEDEANWWDDNVGHGTHCAGIIGALLNHKGIKSYVPEASIYSYRVFSSEDAGASTFDIVKALTRAIADGCDLISMSLGSATAQSSIREQIELAYNKGIACIAATGNDGGPVSYPAAFPTVVGVGAYGKFGTYPDDSLHKDVESERLSEDKQRFWANFSNFGEQCRLIAPGVAIVSTVPGGYASWDGTSMACPHVTGMAALALAAHPDLLGTPREAARAERLIKMMAASTRKLGIGETYEGAGCPQVDLLLAAK